MIIRLQKTGSERKGSVTELGNFSVKASRNRDDPGTAGCLECSETLRRSAYRQRLMLAYIEELTHERELQEKAHRKVLEGLKEHLASIEQTFSWRVTAPIRWMNKVFRIR